MKRKRVALPLVKDCSDCGACCTEQAALPVHLVGEYAADFLPVNLLLESLAEELRQTAARFVREGFPPDGSPCIWYDAATKGCRHYEHRPELCRDEVNPGDQACMKWRRKLTTYRMVGGRVVRHAQA